MGKVVDTGLLTVEQFDAWWPQIKVELQRVSHLWSLHWTLDSLYENVMNEHMQCWMSGVEGAVRLVLLTRICCFPSNRILQTIVMFGNSLQEHLPSMIATVESYARDEGCTAIEIVGRRGWCRIAMKEGCRELGTVFAKDLRRERLQ